MFFRCSFSIHLHPNIELFGSTFKTFNVFYVLLPIKYCFMNSLIIAFCFYFHLKQLSHNLLLYHYFTNETPTCTHLSGFPSTDWIHWHRGTACMVRLLEIRCTDWPGRISSALLTDMSCLWFTSVSRRIQSAAAEWAQTPQSSARNQKRPKCCVGHGLSPFRSL